MRDKVKQNLRFERSEMPLDEAAQLFGKMSSGFQSRTSARPENARHHGCCGSRRCQSRGRQRHEVSVYKTGQFYGFVPWTRMSVQTQRNRPREFQIDARLRSLLARQSGTRANAASLWCRLRYEERTRRVFRSPRRSEETRSSKTRPRTRACSCFINGRPGPRSGCRRERRLYNTLANYMRRCPVPCRLCRSERHHWSSTRPCGRRPAIGQHYRQNMFLIEAEARR